MKKGLRITLIVIGALFVILTIATILDKPTPATTQETEKDLDQALKTVADRIQQRVTTDSLELVKFLGNIEYPDEMKVFVTSFTQIEAIITVTLPNEQINDDSQLDGLGTEMCKCLTQWLVQKDYDMADYDAQCVVAGEYTGVTEQQRYIPYGVATYDYDSDSILWVWIPQE